MVKDHILLKVLNTWWWKLIQIAVGNVMLIMNLSIKLNRAHALLFTIREKVILKILRSIYFAISGSYLSYCSFIWTHNSSTIHLLVFLQKKAVWIINFQPRNFYTSLLFKQSSIQDKTCLQNILFVCKIFK